MNVHFNKETKKKLALAIMKFIVAKVPWLGIPVVHWVALQILSVILSKSIEHAFLYLGMQAMKCNEKRKRREYEEAARRVQDAKREGSPALLRKRREEFREKFKELATYDINK